MLGVMAKQLEDGEKVELERSGNRTLIAVRKNGVESNIELARWIDSAEAERADYVVEDLLTEARHQVCQSENISTLHDSVFGWIESLDAAEQAKKRLDRVAAVCIDGNGHDFRSDRCSVCGITAQEQRKWETRT